MSRILFSSTFKRAFKRCIKKNPQLVARVNQTITEIVRDHTAQKLKTHALQGKHAGKWSSTVAYDLRIMFKTSHDPATNELVIELLNIGTHDEVY
jgi:mRNA interferase YafQ